MKLAEAMKAVWKSDTSWLADRLAKWLTMRNIFQWLTLLSGIFIIILAWIPAGYFFQTGPEKFQSMVWQDAGAWAVLFLFCCGFAVFWSAYWLKVLNKWWPFDEVE